MSALPPATPGKSRELYWFRTDLRLHDNPGLLHHARGRALLCVYCLHDNPGWCNTIGMGAQRRRFLLESLAALDQSLAALGQRLLVVQGDPRSVIPALVNEHGIESVGTSLAPGYYESRQVAHLQQSLSIPVVLHGGHSMLGESQLPGGLAGLAPQFAPFRRRVEDLQPQLPVAAPATLPPPPSQQSSPLPAADTAPHLGFPVRGGERAGLERLANYLQRRAVDTYKETRNELQGQYVSSGLSPWLANGSLSVRTVAHALLDYECTVLRNESTRWLYQELLWREYFHWRSTVDGARLFAAGGISDKRPVCCFEPRDYARWCQGDTDYPLVNALMRQLVASGYMSNRGRQIVASCLVNELNMDWRYGAAFFEKHLLDFDVASNYGNWQYIAGVGCDPRGGRHFNLQKQAQLYDPEGMFTAQWGGFRPPQPRYVTDAADWPTSAPGGNGAPADAGPGRS